MNNYLLVTGGTVSKYIFDAVLLKYKFNKIVVADKGMEACLKVNIIPDLIVGDYDSVSSEALAHYRGKTKFIDLQVHKDLTDTHAALIEIIKDNPDLLIILGATGTRVDHSLANLGLLKLCIEAGIKAYIIDENNRIQMINKSITIEKDKKYPYISLVPFAGEVQGVTLEGFEYTGANISLKPWDSLGVSNSIASDSGVIHMSKGELLIVESHD